VNSPAACNEQYEFAIERPGRVYTPFCDDLEELAQFCEENMERFEAIAKDESRGLDPIDRGHLSVYADLAN
jgi:hypothetical protein